MSDYRLYFLDQSNHIRRAVELLADSDAEAIQLVEGHAGDHKRLELWNRDRRVKVWSPDADNRSSDE